MDFTDLNNIGKEYKDFVLLSVDSLPDFKAKGVFLRHKYTGLEIYHFVNDDIENLFAFAFRTVAKDSLGTAHIMEHSTLCGSEKYPLKEPFNTLASTSLNTYLNALTYPDKTVYPGASVVRADYFNMMSVYADSVFFPKLDYTTFIQEGHRLEMDEKGKLSIQGVVYNEMKGNYTSFPQIAYSQLIGGMFPESYPAFDSGGDPVNIPELTYQQFLDFHQKFYNPDNCLLFLYGNISTKDQIDFLDTNFISRIKEKYNCNSVVSYANEKKTFVKSEIQDLMKLKLHEKPVLVKEIAPDVGSTGSFVDISWYCGERNIEQVFLSEVLCGNDSSPLTMALNDSKLGDEPSCGIFTQFKQGIFNVGLFGVKKGNEQKVFDLIQKTIKDIYEHDIHQEDIDSAIMGIDFSLREMERYYGPCAIQYMEKAARAWCYGQPCNSFLSPISDVEAMKEKLKSDKNFTKNLIKKYFIDNSVFVKFISEPSKEYFKNRNKIEAELIKKLEKNLDKEQLKKNLDKLHEYQQHIETPEETACIPSTRLAELDSNVDYAKIQLDFLEGKNGHKVPYFISQEDTKGLFYMEVLFPFDRLEPKYYPYITFLSQVLTNIGWNGKKWDKCISDCGCVMGDVWGRTLFGNVTQVPECIEEAEKYNAYKFTGRSWLGLSCKALTQKAEETLKMLAEIITKMDFDDLERFQTLVSEMQAEKKAEFVSAGRDYAAKRAKCTLSKEDTISEILSGLSQYFTVMNINKKNIKEILSTYKYIYYECLKAGGIVHITADEDSLKLIRPMMEKFVVEADISELLDPIEYSKEEFMKLVYKGELATGDFCEQDLVTKSQTGYAVAISKASDYLTKDAASEIILGHWLSSHILWDKIRTTGGAYGVVAYPKNDDNFFLLSSYRDPAPVTSIKVFKDSLKELINIDFDEDEIEKTIVSCYGDAIVPQSARERGMYSFSGILYGNPAKFRLKKVQNLMEVTKEDLKQAAIRLSNWSEQQYRTAIFCDKSEKISGNILKIEI